MNLDSFEIAYWSLEVPPSFPALSALQKGRSHSCWNWLLHFPTARYLPPLIAIQTATVRTADKSSHCMELRTAITDITLGNLRSKRDCSCSWKPQRIRSASVMLLSPCHFFYWSNTKIPSSKDFPLIAAWGHGCTIRKKENYPNEDQVPALHV